jgi:hypothetical protein
MSDGSEKAVRLEFEKRQLATDDYTDEHRGKR